MSRFLTVLRWTARLSALVVVGGFVILVVGEFLQPNSGSPSHILLSTAVPLLTATCTGMLVAWRWELAGATISLVALLAFTLLVRMGHHAILFVFAVPGLLFLVDWVLRRRLEAAC
jgi:hypothetical protein